MLLSYTEAQAYFKEHYNVDYTTVHLRRLAMHGKLPIVKLFNGRTFIRSEDLDRLIEASFVPASVGPLASEPMGVHRG